MALAFPVIIVWEGIIHDIFFAKNEYGKCNSSCDVI
jgi:hypothetical protein